jgi:hypothetical protein
VSSQNNSFLYGLYPKIASARPVKFAKKDALPDAQTQATLFHRAQHRCTGQGGLKMGGRIALCDNSTGFISASAEWRRRIFQKSMVGLHLACKGSTQLK